MMIPPALSEGTRRTYLARLSSAVQLLAWPPAPGALEAYVHAAAEAGLSPATAQLTIAAISAAARGDVPEFVCGPLDPADLRAARRAVRRWQRVTPPTRRPIVPTPESVDAIWLDGCERAREGEGAQRAIDGALCVACFWLATRAAELGRFDARSAYDPNSDPPRALVPASKRSSPAWSIVHPAARPALALLADHGVSGAHRADPARWVRAAIYRASGHTPHDFRSGWATWAAGQGVSAAAIARHLRNKDISTTYRYVQDIATDGELTRALS